MLGTVNANVTYSVADTTWKIKMTAVSPEKKTRKCYKVPVSSPRDA